MFRIRAHDRIVARTAGRATTLFVAVLLVTASAVATSGCGSSGEPQSTSFSFTDDESVYQRVLSLNRAKLYEAYDCLADLGYQEEIVFIRRDADDNVVATGTRTREVRDDGDTRTMTTLSDAGEFTMEDGGSSGTLVEWLAGPTSTDDEPNRLALLLEDRPPYLEGRNREQYVFYALPDTVIGGRRSSNIGASSRSTIGEDPSYAVRLLADPETDLVVGMQRRRRQRALLFDRSEEIFLVLQPATDRDCLAPAQFSYAIRTRMPFRDVLDIKLTHTYRLIGTTMPASTSAGEAGP